MTDGIEVNGIDQIFSKFDRVTAFDTLEPPMQRGVLRMQNYMQDYPPAPAHSHYIRTGTLGRRWTTQIDRSSDGLIGRIGNNTSYGPWVQSAAFQRRIFARIGWHTDEQGVDTLRVEIVADFQAAVNEAIK
jgi:hypothetical protein